MIYCVLLCFPDGSTTKTQPSTHDILKEQHTRAGILGELQQRQHAPSFQPQEDYENVPQSDPNHALQAGSARRDYVNEPTIQALHEAGPSKTGTDSYSQGEYVNNDALGEFYRNRPTNESLAEYGNQSAIQQSREQGLLHTKTTSQEYANEEEIRRLASNSGLENSAYNNQEQYENQDVINEISRNKTDQEENVYNNMPAIQLRSSMGPDQLGENIENLFGTVLRNSEKENIRASQRKGPVLMRKSRQEKKNVDKTGDYRISRSSFFNEVEDESGPDMKKNMVEWPAQTVTPQMMTSKATAMPTKPDKRAGFFGFLRK